MKGWKFTPRPGLDIKVKYAANGHVCRIEIPATAPADLVNEVIPVSVRGKELFRSTMINGTFSSLLIGYENVTVAVVSNGNEHTGTM